MYINPAKMESKKWKRKKIENRKTEKNNEEELYKIVNKKNQ